jgi:hypothetical protein
MEQRHRQRTRPRLESLEDRTLMSTCHVTRLTDQGIGKGFRGDLRYCINKANVDPGEDLIIFTPNAFGTINLTSELPHVSDDLIIAGPRANVVTIRRHTGGDYRIFTVDTGVNAQIYSVTVTNGFPQGNLPNQYKGKFGGGIYNHGTLTLGGVAVVGNSSQLKGLAPRGGGIYNEGVMTIYDTTIADNTAIYTGGDIPQAAYGGGIMNDEDATLTISQSTIANNSAEASTTSTGGGMGGGIGNDGGVLTIGASTITGNEATLCGGGTYGAIVAHNTIVSGNTAGNGTETCSGSVNGMYNLIGGNAMLGPLQNNGGPTDTVALLPGSPAIDAGDNTDAPEFDQRGPGFPRIVNGTIDIGAFEVQATAMPALNYQWALLLTAGLQDEL